MAGWRTRGLAVAVVVLAAVLRLHGLGARSLTYVEIANTRAARTPAKALPAAIAALDTGGPLYLASLYEVAARGVEEARLRAPAAVLGIAGVAVLLAFSWQAFGPHAALLAALLLAISPLHVTLSREVRPETLQAFALLVFLGAVWRWSRGRGGATGCAAAAALALYADYDSQYVLAAAAVWAFVAAALGWMRDRRAHVLLLAAAAAGLSLVPWWLFDLSYNAQVAMVRAEVTWRLGGEVLRAFTPAGDGPWGLAAAGACAALAGIGAIVAGGPGVRSAVVLVVLALVAGVGGAAASASMWHRLLVPSQLAFVLPLYLLLVARGVVVATGVLPGRWGPPAGAGIAAVVAIAVVSPSFSARSAEPSEDWRAAAAVLTRNIGPGDAALAPERADAILFYAPELERRLRTPTRLREVPSRLVHPERAWIIAPLSVQLRAKWAPVKQLLEHRIVVDLSPADDPSVYLATNLIGIRATYRHASSFALPPELLARRPILRDFLIYAGTRPTVLRQIDRLVEAEGLSLRNHSLLQAVAVLMQEGELEHARALAARIVEVEPDWLAARQALAAVEAGEEESQKAKVKRQKSKVVDPTSSPGS